MLEGFVDTVILGLDRLFRLPSDNGEQTMIGLGSNVFIYTYLQLTNQYNANLEISSQNYILNGEGVLRLSNM